MSYKDSVKKSIERNYERNYKTKVQEKNKKNKKTEEQVVKNIYLSMKKAGFLPRIVESKAVYSLEVGSYLSSQVDPGTSDILAVSPEGFFVAVEVKSKGRRSTLKMHQKDFLLSVISRGGFACCSDSPEHFHYSYNSWIESGKSSEILVKDLPVLSVEKDSTDKSLF